MTPEIQHYYENRFSMMATKGWADFVEDTQNILDNYNNVVNITTEKDLYYKQGQLDILNWILSLKHTSELAYEELSLEEDI